MSKCEKQDDFIKLVNQYTWIIEEEDLKSFLDKRMDLLANMYGWFFTSIIGAVAALVAVQYFTKILATNWYLLATSLIAVSALLLILVVLAHKITGTIRPFKAQKKLMEQYLGAKGELRSKKLSSDE